MALSILCQLPSEVLDQIAYFLGSDPFLGPPAALVPLLLTNRELNSRLSLRSNSYLYGRIFYEKYDISAARERFGDRLTSAKLADELRRRSIVLKRLKRRIDLTRTTARCTSEESKFPLQEVLFTAYTLILEDEGKNMIQLRQYGRIHDWIREFWFHPRGSSMARYYTRTGRWPLNRTEADLGMWLFWLLLEPEHDRFDGNNTTLESPLGLLKAVAFGNPLSLSATSWIHYDPQPSLEPLHFTLYSEEISFTPTPMAIPAILSYFAFSDLSCKMCPVTPQMARLPHPAWQEWSVEWARCFSTSYRNITDFFIPGSMDGVWEGFFLYIEFASFGSDTAPSDILRSNVGKHKQTWRLREYHLLSKAPTDTRGSDSRTEGNVHPLPVGDPLKSFFPSDAQLREISGGLVVQYSGCHGPLRYHSSAVSQELVQSGEVNIRDVVIIGEGHSAWGQSRLVARVRPCDGFISLSKDYDGGRRGQWLYRGYLVGNTFGQLAGRWRDAVTPVERQGYEGCFVMCRRR